MNVERVLSVLRERADRCRRRRTAAKGELLMARLQLEIDELNAIGRALSSQRDLDRLLELILEKSRHVTGADAGSIYVVSRGPVEISSATLRFRVAQNDSVAMDLPAETLPVGATSIVGRSVLERRLINIADLYRLDAPGTGNNPWGFRHNRELDEKIGYQSRSILAVPMIDAENRVIGVVQLINRKLRPDVRLTGAADFEREVVPFDEHAENLAATLASQAGICLENALLYEEIRNLFEGFVTASVSAIEQRDPTTSGHSQRVADMTVALARVTDGASDGRLAGWRASRDELKQIEYAALLHDFGKVGVREHVLTKAQKLLDVDLATLLGRLDDARRDIEAEIGARKVEIVLARPRAEAIDELARLDGERDDRLAGIDEIETLIQRMNHPGSAAPADVQVLLALHDRRYRDRHGVWQRVITAGELEALSIGRGTLTDSERREIEAHVSNTREFLRRIPWGWAFKDVPDYAGAHHEKLDGSGYPRGLRGEQIPIPVRMMTIADIYDALTASDRPYRRALPSAGALDLIAEEVERGQCANQTFSPCSSARRSGRSRSGDPEPMLISC